MKPRLLDVNVLIALVDTGHVHHRIAHDWFTQEGSKAWATCPFTESGMVRILSNPKYSSQPLSARDVAVVLAALKNRFAGTHQFWPDSLSINDECFDLGRVTGAKQITDMYLLGLAAKNGGALATFDRRMDWQMVLHQSQHLITLLP